jgi:adenylosuccinate synthase
VVSSLAHLIFPWHQRRDAVAEMARGDAKIGTTLKGIGPAYADKASRIGLRVGEVLDLDGFAQKVRTRAEWEDAQLVALGDDGFDVAEVVAQQVALAERLQPYVADTVGLLHDAVEAGGHLLLEGAQATFLDLDHGTYPFVTSSNPTAGGACAGTGLGPRLLDRIVGIAKAYTTRVGSGPFPTELTDARGDALVDLGHEFGTVTGRRRRTGWVDAVMLRHAVRVNSLTEIALTKLDVLDTFDEVQMCVGYELDGQPFHGYPDRAEILARISPVMVTMPGWRTSLAGARSFEELPAAARTFVETLEREVGVPIRYVGTGPGRDDMAERLP